MATKKLKKVVRKTAKPTPRVTKDDWESVLADPRRGLASLLAPLATTVAGRACIEVLVSHAIHPRVEEVTPKPLDVEHEEQMPSVRSAKPTRQLMVDIVTVSRKLTLSVGKKASGDLGFESLRLGSIWVARKMATSVWDRDEWKFEGVSRDVTTVLMECECLAELGSHQWVVARKAKRPWYLVTGKLHEDFDAKAGILQYGELDPSLGLGEIFLRAAASRFLPVAGKKALFDPKVVVTAERAYVPEADSANAPWRAELEVLLGKSWSAAKITKLVQANPAARPRLLQALAQGSSDALMAGEDLFEDEPEWIAALITASRLVPFDYLVLARLKEIVHADARARLEELFRDGPRMKDGVSERALLELAIALDQVSDPRVTTLVNARLRGKRLKDAEYAVKNVLKTLPLTSELRESFQRYLAKHGPKSGDIPEALHAIWKERS